MNPTRIIRDAAVTLTHTFYVDETATDPDPDSATIQITKADGSDVVAAGTAATNAGVGIFTYTLAAQSALDVLTVAWTATFSGAAVVQRDVLEIVGGFYFSLSEGRGSDSSLASSSDYTTAELVEARTEVEVEFEEICGVAFVPRFGRATLDGDGTDELLLPDLKVREVLACSIDGTAMTSGQLAKLDVDDAGALTYENGVFPTGRRNVVVAYSHGYDSPPADLRRAALVRLRERLNMPNSAVPARAVSFAAAEGGTYRLDTAGRLKTGNPDIDGVLARHDHRCGFG